MTNAHFSQSACLGLWLLDANHGISALLSAVPNLATTMLLAEMTAQGYWLSARLDLQIGSHGALNLKCVGDSLHQF